MDAPALLIERALAAQPNGVVSACLFGSHVEGRAHRESDIDVVILNDAPPHLGRRIVTEGRRVFCADPEADLAFVRDVQLRAADLEPFLRRMRRLKLDGLARP